MERIFGRTHTDYVHNLAGNTKALKNVRQTTGKYLPSRLAEWTLEYLYLGLDYWAFTYYDTVVHPSLGVSPLEAYDRSIQHAGLRSHRIVTLTQDFLILTCPTVERKGQRTVDRQRGIKVHSNYAYWSPEFRDPKLHGKLVPARYDPWDASTVYVQIDKRWMPARCKTLINLDQMTEKERELFTTELRKSSRIGNNVEISQQRLAEFMRAFTPKGAAELALERQQENRDLYEGIGIGAIAKPHGMSRLAYTPTQPTPQTLPGPATEETYELIDAPTLPHSAVGDDSDTPEFDTF